MKRLFLFLLPLLSFCQTTTTTVSVGSALATQSLKAGINLGTLAPYGSQQIYKNIFAQNPGFTNSYDSTFLYCGTGTNNTLCVNTNSNYQGSAFWPAGSPVTVITGAGRGTTCTVSSWSNPDLYLNSGCNILGSGTFAGAYVQVSMVAQITGANLASTTAWNPGGYGTLGTDYTFSISSDVPSGSSSNTQSVDMAAISSTGAAYLSTYGVDNLYFNPTTGPSYSSNFLDLNGTYTITFWAKAVSGTSPSIYFYVGRSSHYPVSYNGSTPASSVTIPLTTSWVQYTVLAYPTETGSQSGAITANFATTSQEEFKMTKLSMVEPTTSGNPTKFRDAVVNQLKALAPGTIRDWDNQDLTNTMANMLADQYSTQANNFATSHTTPFYWFIQYSYPDFLQLCQTVGANPWISIPVSTTAAEAQLLVDYLAGGSTTTGGALRISQGQTAPWTSVFQHIYIEAGNEEWNPTFEGASMEGGSLGSLLSGYGVVCQSIFSVIKASADYSSVINLVAGGQHAYSFNQQQVQLNVTANDSMAVGPYHDDYVLSSQFDTTQDIWQPALAQGQVFWLSGSSSGTNEICQNYISGSLCPSENDIYVGNYTAVPPSYPTYGNFYGGGLYLNQLTQNYGPTGTTGKQLVVYEEGVMGGGGTSTNITQTQMNAYTSAWGQGLSQAGEFMNNMLNGVMAQNYFQLYQYTVSNFYNESGVQEYYYGWGCAIDAGGPTNGRFRPQCLAEQVLNAAIGTGYTMLSTTNTAANLPCGSSNNPSCFGVGTPSSGSAVNGIATRPIPIVQSFAFSNSTGYALILLNYDTQYSQTINFTGSIVPNGSVYQTTLTSANLSDTNESSNVIAPTYSNLMNPTSITMPAYSIVTLTWGSGSGGSCTSYYISNSGSDSNSGCSSSLPWQTISKLNTASLAPGNSVYFAKGGTYNGQVNITVGGTSGSPISFSSYGSGANPIISGTTYGIYDTSPSYHTFSNLQITGATAFGFYATASSGTFNNEIVDNVISEGNGSNGIYELASGSAIFNGFSVYSSTVYSNGASGIKLSTYGASANITNCSITNNISYSNSQLPSTTGPDNQSDGGIYLVSPSNQSAGSGCVISGNTVYNEGSGIATPSGMLPDQYGNGVWADTLTGVKVLNNKSYGNNAIGIYGEKLLNSVVYANLSYNNFSNSSTNFEGNCTDASGPGVGGNYNSSGNLWFKNTCVGTGRAGFTINYESSSCCTISNETIEDNIFNNTSGNWSVLMSAQVAAPATSSIVFSHNSFGVAPGGTGNFIYWNSTNYSTYSAFETAWGTSTNSLQTNPLFVNASANNYALSASSPARGYGLINTSYPALCGGNPDLGAIDYTPCGSGITLSPAYPTVSVGQSVTITASAAATFTCNPCAGGSITTTSNTVTYTAPSTLSNPPGSILGVQISPPASIFTTPVNNLPLNSNNSTWKTASSALPLSFQPSWGATYLDSSSGSQSLLGYYFENSGTFPWAQYDNLKRESGNLVGNALAFGSGAYDHHIMGIYPSTNTFYDSYNDLLNQQTVTCGNGTTTGCNVSSLFTYPWSNYIVPSAGGTDAAGLPLAPLALTLAELNSGYIGHALKLTTAGGYIQGNAGSGTPLLWPAVLSNGCATATCPNAPIIGARAIMSSSYSVSGATADTTTILNCLKTFGAIWSDIGTSNAIITDLDTSNDTNAQAAFTQIYNSGASIANSMNFVDESSLEVAANSFQTCPYNTTCVNGNVQSYVNPPNQVIITATPSSGTAATADIAVQGITIGSKLPTNLYIQSGSYTFQFAGWVNGTTNQTINWTSTGSGTITSSGVYTPGTSGTANVTGTAAADSTVIIKFIVTIIPAGIIRIDTGSLSNNTDSNGNSWLGGWQPQGCSIIYSDAIYGNWSTSSPFRLQYESGCYNNNSDLVYNGIILPNGDYDITFYLGLKAQCGQLICGTFLNGAQQSVFTYAPLTLEANEQVSYSLYDWLLPVSYVSAMPTPTITIPGWVQNNTLYIALRAVANDSVPHYATSGGIKSTTLQGLTIATAANPSPHWTINTQQQSTISSGQTLNPFLVIPWFTAAPSTVSWSVQGPPGISINSSTGVLSASSSATFYAAQPVTVTATNGTLSASATIYTLASKYIY